MFSLRKARVGVARKVSKLLLVTESLCYNSHMIYLIGGVARVGKTTLSRRMLEENKIPYIPADLLRNSLYHYLNKDLGKWEDRPEFFFPYLSDFIKRSKNKYHFDGCVIEGDIFLPEQIASLPQEGMKCIFLGTGNITLEQIMDNDLDSWVHTMDPENRKGLAEGLMRKSKMFKAEAEKHGFAYFDIYPDRDAALKAAKDYLLN